MLRYACMRRLGLLRRHSAARMLPPRHSLQLNAAGMVAELM